MNAEPRQPCLEVDETALAQLLDRIASDETPSFW
jgi:hypothetical protein